MLLTTALTKTQAIWPALQIAWEWLHQVASILQNHEHRDGAGVQEQLQAQLSMMQDHQGQVVGDESMTTDRCSAPGETGARGMPAG